MKKLSVMFAALAIVFAVSSAFTTNHSTAKKSFTNWFAVAADVTPTTFQSTAFDDIETYNAEEALTDPPQACSQTGSKVCAAEVVHSIDPDFLDQADLTSQAYSSIIVELRYKN